MTFFQAIAANPLILFALLAGIAASIVSGIIGAYVVVKRIVFISGGISHSVLGGIGICLWLQRAQGIEWASPLLGALAAAVASALLIGWIHIHYREREDSAIAALWSVGMAVGVLFISQTPGFNVELTNFLIGNILWVRPVDLATLFALDALVVIAVLTFHKSFLAMCFDADQARLQGLPINALYSLLLVLTAVTIVLLIQVVGIILVITLLTIPAAIANLFSGRLSHIMMLAIALCAIFSTGGIAASFHLDWPSGPTIALFAGAAYLIALALKGR